MKLTNIGNFNTIGDFISHKIKSFGSKEKTFSSLFSFMFSEKTNIMAELPVGYRVKKVTYGEVEEQIYKKAFGLKQRLNLPLNSFVGIYMDNSLEFIKTFWAVLMCGYNPLLLNMRLADQTITNTLLDYQVNAVISDGKIFSVNTILASSIEEIEQNNKFNEWGTEVIFMSSGTTDNVKLCAYTAENFYYQLQNSVDIITKCPKITRHYEGELKLLTLLPFYHVFGFIAVYLWFGFFARTFVFLSDLNAKTIQSTIKRRSVTHLFAVPLVWEAVYKTAITKIKNKGQKTYNKFIKGLNIVNQAKFGKRIALKQMSEIRDNLFGDSIQFLISGGGFISNEALEFFNGIGYHLANGYGMTEVGITSVEISQKKKELIKGSIGASFTATEYDINSDGILLIRGKNMASKIMQGKEVKITDFNEWFNSNDLAKKEGDRYYLLGRCDDLIVHSNGENINPQMIENALKISNCERACLFNDNGCVTLIIEAKNCYTNDKLKEILDSANSEIARLCLSGVINKILITKDSLLGDGEFKISRKKIAKRYKDGQFSFLQDDVSDKKECTLTDELETKIVEFFAESLSVEVDKIGLNANFFIDLNGSSLDYFLLSDKISAQFGVDIKSADGQSLNTVYEICDFIKTH